MFLCNDYKYFQSFWVIGIIMKSERMQVLDILFRNL